jgi:signal transduction histidine kinase
VTERRLESGTVSFEAEGRLLQELGERLVANPDIALVELLKNAYDADAPSCTVSVDDAGSVLQVRDDGSGMTRDQFLNRWMKIATGHKLAEPVSPRFGRRRTGQKGIGRFAVRFLGSKLELTTVAHDSKLDRRTKLRATFDWTALDAVSDLKKFGINYTLTAVDPATPTGTTLEVSELRHSLEFLQSKDFRTRVLRIVSPFESLERGRFKRASAGDYEDDPGFRVNLPASEGEEPTDIGRKVLDRAWGRLHITLTKKKVEFEVYLAETDTTKSVSFPLDSKIASGFFADIRFFPRRQGIFGGGDVDGRAAWTWVRENCGVAVIDHGFRIRPYGFKNDDWLHLDADTAHNERNWRSSFGRLHFPIPQEIRSSRPGDNPALNLPTNYQLVGAVFLESDAGGSGDGTDLTVAMDREGFLENEAFDQLVDVVRGGIEYLAHIDKRYLAKLDERRAAEAAARAREDFHAAIQSIRSSPTLSSGDKNRLVKHYSELSKKVEEVEQYSREARRKLETMGLLGVVAGFMTHEAARILDALDTALQSLRRLATKDPQLKAAIAEVETGYSAFRGHVEYTSMFIDSMQRVGGGPFSARSQVQRILDKFGSFAEERHLNASNEVAEDARVVGVPVAAYSGIVLNLYTNALKAVLAREGGAKAPQIAIRGWNENDRHVIEVCDKGVGVPPELRERIFDPLFTTTSNVNNPLGSGMGLGLSIVKEVVHHSNGRIMLADPPAGFSTCFRVAFGAHS